MSTQNYLYQSVFFEIIKMIYLEVNEQYLLLSIINLYFVNIEIRSRGDWREFGNRVVKYSGWKNKRYQFNLQNPNITCGNM